jgi:hypothetical protein
LVDAQAVGEEDMKKLFLLIWIVILLVSAALAPFLITRYRAEATRTSVTLAITYDDVLVLAEGSGIQPGEWLRTLRETGLGLVFLNKEQFQDEALTNVLMQMGLPVGTVGVAPAGIPIYLPDETAEKSIAEPGTTVGLVENVERMGANLPETFDYGSIDGRAVRILNLWKPYSRSYAAGGYEPGEEVANILFRAVTERSLQILLLKPMLHKDNSPVLEPEEYRRVIGQFRARLRTHGRDLSDYKSADSPWFETGSTQSNESARPMIPDLLLKAAALGISVLFPCLALCLFHQLCRVPVRTHPTLLSALGRFTLLLFSTAGVCVIGGLWIGAVLGSGDYMLEIRHFKGVKLSQLAPVAFSLLWFYRYHTKGNTLRQDLLALGRQMRLPKWVFAIIGAAVILVVAVFIYRTGDIAQRASAPERLIRDTLEHLFYARPRSKEALFALPMLAIAALLSVFGKKAAIPVLGVFVSIGFASIVNTFCHISAPLLTSLSRTAGGVLIALILGALLILAVFFLQRLMHKKP